MATDYVAILGVVDDPRLGRRVLLRAGRHCPLTDKQQALLWRALLGLILVELPVLTYALQQPTFDYRLLAVGLLGAAAGYLEKNVTFDLAPTQPVIVIPPDPPKG